MSEEKIEIEASELQALKEEIAAAKDYSDSAHRMRKVLRELKNELDEKKAGIKDLNAKIKEITLDLEEHLDDNPSETSQQMLPWVDEDISWESCPIANLDLPAAILDSFATIGIKTLGDLESFDRSNVVSEDEAVLAEMDAISEWGEGRWNLITSKLEAAKAK